jgi:hypothetical protein
LRGIVGWAGQTELDVVTGSGSGKVREKQTTRRASNKGCLPMKKPVRFQIDPDVERNRIVTENTSQDNFFYCAENKCGAWRRGLCRANAIFVRHSKSLYKVL